MCFQIIVLKNGSKNQVPNNSLASICLVSQENKYLITTLSTKHINKRLSPQLKWELNPKIYPHIINKTHQIKPEMQALMPSPEGKHQALTPLSEGRRRGEKWNKWRREEEKGFCSNLKHDKAIVVNNGF